MEDNNRSLFCKFCGTLVPITPSGVIKCPLCQEAFPIDAIKSTEIKVKVHNLQEQNDATVKSERTIINDRCPECGNVGLYFTTAQIRSADEGQTIFYECIHCGHKYSQNA